MYDLLGMSEPNARSECRPHYQLSIIDLFAWITFVAIVFTFMQWLYQYSKLLPGHSGEEHASWLFGYEAIFVGAQLAAIFYWVKAKFSTRQFPLHPGHYLLVIGGLAFLAAMAQGIYVSFSLSGSDLGLSALKLCFFHSEPELSVTFLAATFAAIAMRKQWHWLVFFLAIAIYAADMAFLMNRQILENASWISTETSEVVSWIFVQVFVYHGFALIAFPVVCIGIDLRRRSRRDLLHWLGIIAILALHLGTYVPRFLQD